MDDRLPNDGTKMTAGSPENESFQVGENRNIPSIIHPWLMDEDEKLAAVCECFCRGMRVSEIATILNVRFPGLQLTREAPYKYIRLAGKKGLLRFEGLRADGLAQKLTDRFRLLDGIEVVKSSDYTQVAIHAAKRLITYFQQMAGPPTKKQEIHVGFAGGNSMAVLAKFLAIMLREPISGLPRTLVLHALASGFDAERVATDPNAFFLYFEDPALQLEVRYVTLHAPCVVHPGEQMDALLSLPGIRESADRVKSLDIILTSAGSISDEHSMLHRFYLSDERKQTLELLRRDSCVGDMLWSPMSATGPINNEQYPYRAFTLLDCQRSVKLTRLGSKWKASN